MHECFLHTFDFISCNWQIFSFTVTARYKKKTNMYIYTIQHFHYVSFFFLVFFFLIKNVYLKKKQRTHWIKTIVHFWRENNVPIKVEYLPKWNKNKLLIKWFKVRESNRLILYWCKRWVATIDSLNSRFIDHRLSTMASQKVNQ